MSRTAALGLLVATAVIVPGCGKKKTPAVLVVPPSPPPPPPEPLQPPPEVKSSSTKPPEVPAQGIPVPSPPEAAKTAPQRPGPAAGAPNTEPPSPAPAAPAAPLPKLTQLLSPQEQQAYNLAIEEAIRRAEANLATLAGKRLTKEQSVNLERTRTFLRQARETRQADLVTARSLAQRAEVLAEDLVKSLR